jgi:hypothetical protein
MIFYVVYMGIKFTYFELPFQDYKSQKRLQNVYVPARGALVTCCSKYLELYVQILSEATAVIARQMKSYLGELATSFMPSQMASDNARVVGNGSRSGWQKQAISMFTLS